MANFASTLKAEVARLARREMRAIAGPLRKSNAVQRTQIAALKRELVELRRAIRRDALSRPKPTLAEPAEDQATFRFSAKGLKALRAKLGLSASDVGRLIGASGQSVYNWEAGKSVPRQAQRVKLASLRGLGKREARRRLDAMS